ncbi:MAG: hypothetical protein Q3X03_05565 [Eggerthellaceae bacterium]|nr:hypothetical protein [Eggerthellaceae bacterium]
MNVLFSFAAYFVNLHILSFCCTCYDVKNDASKGAGLPEGKARWGRERILLACPLASQTHLQQRLFAAVAETCRKTEIAIGLGFGAMVLVLLLSATFLSKKNA